MPCRAPPRDAAECLRPGERLVGEDEVEGLVRRVEAGDSGEVGLEELLGLQAAGADQGRGFGDRELGESASASGRTGDGRVLVGRGRRSRPAYATAGRATVPTVTAAASALALWRNARRSTRGSSIRQGGRPGCVGDGAGRRGVRPCQWAGCSLSCCLDATRVERRRAPPAAPERRDRLDRFLPVLRIGTRPAEVPSSGRNCADPRARCRDRGCRFPDPA